MSLLSRIVRIIIKNLPAAYSFPKIQIKSSLLTKRPANMVLSFQSHFAGQLFYFLYQYRSEG